MSKSLFRGLWCAKLQTERHKNYFPSKNGGQYTQWIKFPTGEGENAVNGTFYFLYLQKKIFSACLVCESVLWESCVPLEESREQNMSVARNFMKMNPADRISEILAETHFLLDCICAQRRLKSALAYMHPKQTLCRSSKESFAVLLFSAKQ